MSPRRSERGSPPRRGPVVLAAGGTGGHVFPAQALANELKARGHRLVLITDRRGAGYEDAFPGVRLVRVRAAAFAGRGVAGRLAALAEIAAGTFAARRILGRLGPSAVVGFGGYPSLPAMLAASRMAVPTMVHEQNAVLGRVNRFLAPRVTTVATSFAETRGLGERDLGKAILTGNPVREAVAAIREVPYAPPDRDGALRLLVLGGSQGATVFSDVVPEAAAALPQPLRRRLRVTQQCRPEDIERVRASYDAAGLTADLATFIADVPALLAATHLVLSRAGASTVSELAVAGRPAILVPYPHATDDHQTANARALAQAGGAWLMPEEKFSAAACRESLEALLTDSETLADMAAGARSAGRAGAARDLADLVERLVAASGRGQGAPVPVEDQGRGRAGASGPAADPAVGRAAA